MKIKKAILTGGGRATRLRPITTTINKHLIPLANKPMIFHAIEKAVDAGIEEIFINTNPGETQLQKFVGDGGHWGINITYFEQEGGPQGIAHVVKCAEKFIGSDPFMFYLSDNIILGSLKPFFEQFDTENLDAMMALAKVPDPERFGVPVFDSNGKLIDTLEKPIKPPNDFAVTGIYLFNHKFFEAFDQITKSARGEYEIPSIFSHFLKKGLKVGYREITGWWKDTGKPDDLIIANKLLMDEMPLDRFKIEASGDNMGTCEGKVSVEAGTIFGNNVKLIGPVIIGPNCSLENCTVGPYVTLGSGDTVKQATITNSIIFSNTTIDSPAHIFDSIIGENVVIRKQPQAIQEQIIAGDYTVIS